MLYYSECLLLSRSTKVNPDLIRIDLQIYCLPEFAQA